MRSLSVRLLLSFLVLIAFPALAHDITVSSPTQFVALDGSPSDHDGVANGVFTVNDGNLVINAAINCNDDTTTNACAMAFSVSGNLTVNGGGALYAENRSGSGTGGAITLTVGGDLALNGDAIVSTASRSSSGSTGGAITANVNGNVSIGGGATVDSGAANAAGGAILIAAGGIVSVDGNVLSGPSRTFLSTRLDGGAALDGGTGNTIGGAISITASTFAEPAIVVGTNANIVSQGADAGAGPVTIDGCGIQVRGLVAALARKDGAARVSIRSGKDVLVDGRDLGGTGSRMGRIRADAPTGTASTKGVDIFAAETIDLLGPSGSLYLITSHPGVHDTKSLGGLVRITSLGDAVSASGNVIDAGKSAAGDSGGSVEIAAKSNVNLHTAAIRAVGDFSTGNPNRGGGSIRVRSHSGNVIWTSGLGEVRPVGSSSSLPLADQGSIVLTACGTVDTTGSSYPVMGTATSMFPETHTGVCSPAAPSLPSGVPPLVTCNTPPVANDASASTNEDNAVTITLSGSDADGDSLTFSIVSGPANGSLGPIVPTGPTTATVNYTPNPNFNGADSFVYQANDGNGGTDNATVLITVAAVNDPPSFLAGPTVSVLEDSGPQTVPNWASSISAGPADEAGQTVTFTVTNDNPSLFSVQPAVSSNGTLTFTPAANAYGSANLSITAHDNGGTANGGSDTSAAQSSSITVSGVNDEPSFVKGADQSVNEDAGPQSVSGWATSISAGPNESSQTLTFVTSSDNTALFSVQPSISASGTLSYTPAANANGTAIVTVVLQDNGGTANGGDDTSPAQTFTIAVNSVNDEPSFTSGGNVTVLEDSGAYSAAWASSISAGPADESAQTLSFSVSNDNHALFSVQPAIAADGTLSFTVAANAFGSATVTVTLSDNGGTANGGDDTSSAQTFTLTITAVNDEPSFTAGANVSVLEDSGAYSAAWATGISAGPNETQTLTFLVSNDNSALFASQPALSAAGVLTFTPAANAYGTATVTVALQDDGGTANGGDDTSPSVTFIITIDAVNDAPSYVSGGNVTVNEDSGAYSAAWATAISAGPSNESAQSVTFHVTSNSNPSLFAGGPSISAAGVLSFTINANAFGSATLTVTLSDDGGTANGGADTSPAQTFTITVNAINDAPSFNAGGDVTVNEDSGAYSAAWASAVSAGPGESAQTVAFVVSNGNAALFSAQPSISPAGVLTFTPALNAFGTATVSVYLQDNGGTANGGVDTSATVSFTIVVTGVNDPPSATNDAWETEGNTELRVDHGANTTPYVGDTTGSGTGVLDNDADTVEGDPFTITGIVGCADTVAPFVCAVTGGSVTLESNGSFTFDPAIGATSASFQYTLTDQPAAGTPASATATVSITIHDVIWYVNGSALAGGNGTSKSPFNSFGSLNGFGDVDGIGDYIFVHTSAIAGGIALEDNQKLWGEGVGLIIPRNLNGNGSPATIVAAGTRPTITAATGNTVAILGVTGEVAGLNVVAANGNGIAVTSMPAGLAAFATIRSNSISAVAGRGIDVNAGSAAGTAIRIEGTNVTASGNGIDVNATGGDVVFFYSNGTVSSLTGHGIVLDGSAAGSLTVTGLSDVVISGNTAGNGISIVSARFDANGASMGVPVVNGGLWNIGTSGDAVGGAAVVMTSVSGDLALASLGAHGSTTGVTIAGSGLFTGVTGLRIASGGGAVTAAAGTGLSITNATIAASNVSLTSVSSSGAVNGIVLNNTGTAGGLVVTGTGAPGSGGSIPSAAGDAILLVSTRASFADMSLTNSGQSHIDATNVNGLELVRMTLDNSADHGVRGANVRDLVINGGLYDRGGAASLVANKHGVFITDLLGTSSVTGAAFRRSNTIQFSVANATATNPYPGTPDTLTVSNTTWDTHTGPFAGDHLSVDSGTGGNFRLVTNATAGSNNFSTGGTAVRAASGGTGRLDVSAVGIVANNTTAGVAIGATASSSGTYSISGNTISNSGSVGISVVNVSTGSLNGSISGNAVTNVPSGTGIQAILQGNSSSAASITGNTVSGDVGSNGIRAQASAGTGSLSLNIHTNNVSSTSPFGADGISIESGGSGAGHANTICLNMANNASSTSSGQEGYRLRQRAGTTFNLQNFTGSGTSIADITAWVNTTKSNTGTVDVVIATTFNAASGSCPTP